MKSRVYTAAIVAFSIAALTFNLTGSAYANFQFDCLALAKLDSDCHFSLSQYVASYSSKSLFVFETALNICVYLPPIIAAVRWQDWVVFQKFAVAISLAIASISLLQMLTWEVSNQNGCTGCLLPFLAQLVFAFSILVAAVYRNAFSQVSRK